MRRGVVVVGALGLAVILVTVIQVGVLGLALLPFVLGSLAAVVWGHPGRVQQRPDQIVPPAADDTHVDSSKEAEPVKKRKWSDPSELLEATKAGDQRAISELVQLKAAWVLGLARRYAQSLELDDDDVAQETWIRILAKIDGLNDMDGFHAWAGTILLNVFRDRSRLEGRRPRRGEGELEPQAAVEPRSEGGMIDLQLWLQELESQTALIAVLRIVENQTWKDVAAEMDVLFPLSKGRWTKRKCENRLTAALRRTSSTRRFMTGD